MSEFLFEPNLIVLAVCGLVSLLVLWWFSARADGRWFAALLIGVVIAAGGAALMVMNSPSQVGREASGGGGAGAPNQPTAGGEKADGASEPSNKKSAQASPGLAEREAAERERQAAEARRAAERERQAAQQRAAQEAEARQRAAEAEQKRQIELAQRKAEDEARQAAERAREAARKARETAELPASPTPGDKPVGGAPGDDEKPAERSVATRDAGKPATGASAPVGPPEPAKDKNEPWDIVPVFYGTDRAREDNEKGFKYTADRGKRLELGRVLVSIPKIHEVPNIERPWVYRVPFLNVVIYKEQEDPKKHFTVRELRNLSEDEFIALARTRIGRANEFESHALVFVHGFNTTFDYAVFRTAQLSYDIKFDGGAFVYSWPSRGDVSPIAYSADRESAEQAEGYLDSFLSLIARRSGAKNITIIAHSMGNKLLLPVLQKFKLRNDQDVKISQVILAAPDVDRDTFAGLAREIEGLSKSRVTLYAASNDLALDASRQFWGGIARAGDVPEEGPIVVSGVDTIDVTSTSTAIFSLNHAGYAQSKALLRDIRSLMRDGYRLPNVRNDNLLRVPTTDGAYWKFP